MHIYLATPAAVTSHQHCTVQNCKSKTSYCNGTAVSLLVEVSCKDVT